MPAVRSIVRGPVIWTFHEIRNRAWFEKCVDQIGAAYNVLPLADVANARSPRTCAITFDDGRRSVVEVAAPMLLGRDLPFTVFVCTEVIEGGPVPWFVRVGNLLDHLGSSPVRDHWGLAHGRIRTRQDVVSALKQVPLPSLLEGLDGLERRFDVKPPVGSDLFVTADEVEALAAAGVAIGSHTHRHPILSLLDAPAQLVEIQESVRIIERLTGQRPTEFAYPNGSAIDFDGRTLTALRSSGIRIAVTTTPRRLSLRDNPLTLPRVGFSDGDSYARRLLKFLVPSLSQSGRREHRLRSRTVA